METMNNPYREFGYTATLHQSDIGDFMLISRNGKLICEVMVTVPMGENARAEIAIKRFAPNELKNVSTRDDYDGSDDE